MCNIMRFRVVFCVVNAGCGGEMRMLKDPICVELFPQAHSIARMQGRHKAMVMQMGDFFHAIAANIFFS